MQRYGAKAALIMLRLDKARHRVRSDGVVLHTFADRGAIICAP
jgi:hypothetical protein